MSPSCKTDTQYSAVSLTSEHPELHNHACSSGNPVSTHANCSIRGAFLGSRPKQEAPPTPQPFLLAPAKVAEKQRRALEAPRGNLIPDSYRPGTSQANGKGASRKEIPVHSQLDSDLRRQLAQAAAQILSPPLFCSKAESSSARGPPACARAPTPRRWAWTLQRTDQGLQTLTFWAACWALGFTVES